jgi:hypothetical protein
MTLANVRNSFFARELSAIVPNYTVRAQTGELILQNLLQISESTNVSVMGQISILSAAIMFYVWELVAALQISAPALA